MKIILSLVLFMTTLTFAADKNAVVATVNGQDITVENFDQTYKENLLFVGTQSVTKEKVLNDMINRELGLAKAKKARLDRNPTVRKKMDDIMYHAQISKDLGPQLQKIKVSDREVKKYYGENPEYRTAHILFRMRVTPSKAEQEEALKKSMEVYNILRGDPDKFAELANKLSQSTAAPNGGDVGFQPATQYAPEYFKAIKGKSVGFITSPVRTQFGLHIIKVLAKKEFADINKAFYQKTIYDQKRDAIIQKYFDSMRRSASITINKNLLAN